MKRKLSLITCLFVLLTTLTQAQILINYPVQAQDLTRGYGQSLLTVQLGFTGACTGTTVTVALPSSVTYVAGTVLKTAGSSAGSSISESNITNLSAPVFSVSGITGAGDITFTIARRAGCGAGASGKDTIQVSGSCGSAVENNANTNTYNLLAPAVSINPPAAVTGAFTGSTYTRNYSITNGGNGCMDTVRCYIVYPSGGIVNTAANAITANGTSFTPFLTNGDTLFYKIYGSSIFGGDNLLCNGETVSITEPIKVVKCNAAATVYGAGWGRAQALQCQVATATSTVTMATGVANLVISTTDPVPMQACTPGTTNVTYSNTGTGGNAGAIYNITSRLGFAFRSSGSLPGINAGNTLANFRIGSTALTVATAGTASAPFIINLNQLTADPDGAGTGLDDLDGDGQYDDLAPGKSFTIAMDRIALFSTICPRPQYDGFVESIGGYTDMCGTGVTTPISPDGGQRFCLATSSTAATLLAPEEIVPNQVFTFTLSQIYNPYFPAYNSTDSIEVLITLPAGFSYIAGSASLNGSASNIDYAVVTGNVLTIRRKIGSASAANVGNLTFKFDLVYTGVPCAPGPFVFSGELQYVMDRSCGAVDRLACFSRNILVKCPSLCASGMGNYQPVIQRQSLGWTDKTLTVKVNPASLSSLSLHTLLAGDTATISSGAKENGTFSNLYYSIQLDKASGAGDIFNFVKGTLNFKASGSATVMSAPVAAPVTTGSTSSLTKWDWNLTPLLGTGGIPGSLNTGDSVWIVLYISVLNPNNGVLLGSGIKTAPNAREYFYNLDASNAPAYCDSWWPEIYVAGLATNQSNGNTGSSRTLIGCSPASIEPNYFIGIGEPYDIYIGEFRPSIYLDSVVITLPVGITWNGGSINHTSHSWSANGQTSVSSSESLGATATVRGQDVILKNPGNWSLSDMPQANSSYFNAGFIVPLIANCNYTGSTGAVTVTQKFYGKNYYYDMGFSATQPVAASSTITNVSYLSIDNARRPAVTVQNNTGAVQGVLSQYYWDVQVNSAGTVTASYIWLALEKGNGSGGITIDSVVAKPSNAVLAPASYNTTDKWYQVSTSGLASGTVQQARVYFKYNSCNADSVLLKAGWNCTGYPSPNPLTGYNCTAAQSYLKVVPQPSQVQLSVSRQPGNGSSISLCTTDSVLITVNSAQAGNLLSPYVNVYPPAGVTLQMPVQIEYPLGSGNYQSAAATAISGGYKIDLTNHTGIGTGGLPGTVLNPATAGRQAKLKVMFSTGCGITSGSPLAFESYGMQACGAAATGSGSTALTAGVNITGAATAGSAGMTLSLGTASLLCGAATTLSLSTTPVITPTQAGDTVIYTIPAGLAYAGNFTGSGFGTVTSVPGAGGTTLVKVPLPAGVAAGSSIPYGFDVAASGIGGCGNTSITALAKRDIAPLICGGTPCTSSSAIIGTAASSAITLTKPSLSTGAFTFTETGVAPSMRTVNYSFTITNSGTTAAAAGAYLIKIFCGNASGKVLSTFTNNAVPAGLLITQTGTFTYTVPVDCPYGSKLFLQIQDTTSGGSKVCLCASPAGALSSQTVPVKLSSFTGAATGCNALLTWRTEEEINFDHFEAEQSTDNVYYSKIAAIPAKGSSTGGTYSGLYSQNGGTAYYRLKIVDKDGTYIYSNVVPVRTSCISTTIAAYPNPADNLVTLTGLSGKSQIRLLDVAGRVLKEITAVTSTYQLDISQIASGTYILQAVQGNQPAQSIRIIKK